jgi:phospho-N-acetylmuramoyl-pentapeptide-transferase
MFYLLVEKLETWLKAHNLDFFRVFRFVTFQTAAAIMLSFLIVLLVGPKVIDWLRKKKIGDRPEFDQADINAMMTSKVGTPTMGGLLIITAIAASTLLLADLHNFYVRMALVCLLWLGAVGAVDDWLKLTIARREGGRQGLTSLEKLLFQIGLGVILSYFTYDYGRAVPETHTLFFPFVKYSEWAAFRGLILPSWAFITLGTIVIVGFSNAVNLTDGLDGLASGCTSLVSFAFALLAIFVGVKDLAKFFYLPYIEASGQMAVFAGAMLGACLGFLWYNCNPARVFMGDTGSLAMGGLLGYIAIVTRQELMLVLIGGIFVAEAFSVIIQVGYFKYTKRKYGEGRRVFLMSPIHHHFQKKGWTETQVVVRFWLITAMLVTLGLATIKLR